MISLILYGRNDNYGYNLHKRAALSLHCMAEILHEEDDAILFVDYNTPVNTCKIYKGLTTRQLVFTK